MGKKSKIKLLREIFMAFFKIGSFTFGGGYAMIPLIEREVVNNKGWVKEEEVIDVFVVAESIPGAIAINASTFIGYKTAGKAGAFAAMFGIILPSFIIITVIAAFFSKFQNNLMVQAAFMGIRSAVVGLILMAAVKIVKASVKDKFAALITVLAAILVLIANIHAIFVIIGAASVGLIIYFMFPGKLECIIERSGEKGDIS